MWDAEAATQKYREHPRRCARARLWLGAHGLWHRINEFGEAPDMLRGVGLPWSCRTALIEAASSGVVTEKGPRLICFHLISFVFF